MHILPIYAGLLGLIFFYLSVRTIGFRRKLKIGVGTGDNQEMLRATRVHANFTEYAPITLLLIFLVETQGGESTFIHALGLLLLIGRMLHAYGMSQTKENFVYRASGMIMTFTAIISSSIFLVYNYVVN